MEQQPRPPLCESFQNGEEEQSCISAFMRVSVFVVSFWSCVHVLVIAFIIQYCICLMPVLWRNSTQMIFSLFVWAEWERVPFGQVTEVISSLISNEFSFSLNSMSLLRLHFLFIVH